MPGNQVHGLFGYCYPPLAGAVSTAEWITTDVKQSSLMYNTEHAINYIRVKP